MDYNEFKDVFDDIQQYDKIKIRYTKERAGDIIHKDIYIEKKRDEQNRERYYLKKAELNKTKNTKTYETIENQIDKQEITEDSLKQEHAYLATLFSAIKSEEKPSQSNWQSFKESTSKLKWLSRFFLLDTFLVGGAVGQIIAYAANKENKHYKTIPSNILAQTLGPLIFPAGSKKPTVSKRGVITIDSVLHKQYKALANYNPIYVSNIRKQANEAGEQVGKSITFHNTPVTTDLRGKQILLETITASNNLVKDSKDHLHLIYFNGNSGCFQQDYKLVAEDLLAYEQGGVPVTAIQFNYPGVLNSEGQVEIAQDLIDAGIAQVRALIVLGVDPSKIVLHGVSLGGSISSHVAAHFHALGFTLGGVYASRTFASTAQVGRDFFNRALGDNRFSRLISTLCLPFIKLGTWGSEWDLDTGKAFFSLPQERRNYAVVISPKAHIRQYKNKHRGSFFQEISNFILGKRIQPLDDEILRRGLHDAWEKKLEGFLIKRGFYGKEAQKNYSSENSYRKMITVRLRNEVSEKSVIDPEIAGHADAGYCHRSTEDGWIDPKGKAISKGLLHRAPPIIKIDEKGKRINVLTTSNNEAGKVAREEMARMAGIMLGA